MRRLKFHAPALALIVLGGAGAASAQTSNPVGISLRAGILFPTDSNTSDTFGSTWFALGAEYQLAKLNYTGDMKSSVSLSIDYFSRNALTETPIMLNYVIHSKNVFGDAGVGGSFDHTPGSSTVKLGYQVGVGYDFKQFTIPVFLELKYWGNQDSSLNAVGLYAGVRF